MFLNHRSFGEIPNILWKSFGTFNLQTLKGILKHEKKSEVKCQDTQHKLSAVADNKLWN